MAKLAYALPLAGHAVRNVGADLLLEFDDPARSRLALHGSFRITAGGVEDLYEPPFPPWLRDVLETFLGVPVRSARYSRHGALGVVFEDGRALAVADGPYENWHFRGAGGMSLHGGAGRVA